MSEGLIPEKQLGAEEERPPMSVAWSFDAAVVDAILEELRDPASTLLAIARAAHEKELVKTFPEQTATSIAHFIDTHYQTTFENGGRERLASDLQKQREWLRGYNDLPPVRFMTRIPRSVREAILEKYDRQGE